MTRTFILVCFILAGFVGCASMERFQRSMDSYLGRDIEQLYDVFGYNYIERKIENERRAFTWTWIQRGTNPGYHSPDVIHTYQSKEGTHVVVSPGYYFPPEYYEYICEFTFISNAANKVVSWRAHGNGCLFFQGQRVYQPAQ